MSKRICNYCNINKNIDLFEETTNSRSKTKTYRRVCKKCRCVKRKLYQHNYQVNSKGKFPQSVYTF